MVPSRRRSSGRKHYILPGVVGIPKYRRGLWCFPVCSANNFGMVKMGLVLGRTCWRRKSSMLSTNITEFHIYLWRQPFVIDFHPRMPFY